MANDKIPSKDSLEKSIRGTNSTDGWDVMVAYQEGPLNTLLAEHWGKKMGKETIPIKEIIPVDDDTVLHMYYDITLSAPSLTFAASGENGHATLKFDINGTYYTVIGDSKPKKVHTIPQDEYGLEMNVPIASVTGDGKEHQATDTVIEFKDDTIAKHYIVLHFQSKDTNWQMKKKDEGKKLPTDDSMRKVCGDIALWLGDANNIKWVDFRMAEVSNVKDDSSKATNTDVLRPRSFVLSTAKGVLMVFIKTTSQKDGRIPARFNHKGTDDMLPIPTGSEACIIISQNLFSQFVSDQIKAHCSSSLQDSSSVTIDDKTDSGIKWSLVLSGSKTWNIGNDIGLQKYSIKEVNVDFSKAPLIFEVVDDDKLVPVAKWSFDFTASAKWYLDDDAAGVPRYGVGLTQISAHIAKTGKQFGTLSGDNLQLELDFETESPSIQLKALHVSSEDQYPACNSDSDIPRAFQNISITLPAFKTQLDELSFFAAQNVLVPGVKFIKANEVIVPHDVVILGTMPRSDSKVMPASALMSLGSVPVTEAAFASSNGGTFAELLDELYTDDAFLGEVLNRGISGKPEDVYSLFEERGYKFDKDHVMNAVQELTTPGPNFDLRYAGGVYEVRGGDDKHQILVHPVHRTIFVDGHTVDHQTKHEDGRITFKTRDNELNFEIEFHRENNSGDIESSNMYTLEGFVWGKSQAETDKAPIRGQRVFPWDDETTASDDITRADSEGFKSLAMSLDLINFTADESAPDAAPRHMMMAMMAAEPISAAGVVAILVGLWALDKAVGEGWQRLKKRYNRLKKLVININKNGFMKAMKSSTSKAKLKEAAKHMEEVMDRIINSNLDKSTDPDADIDATLEASKSQVDEQVAAFIYSGFEIAARKGFKGLFTLDQEAAAETLKKTIKDGLGQWVDEEAYKTYLTTKIKRIISERERVALLTKSGGLERRIDAAEKEIERMDRQKRDMEAAKEDNVEKLKEEGLSDEEARKKVEESIQKIVGEIEAKQKEKAGYEGEKKRADEGVDAFTKDIEEKKKQEEAQRDEIWKKGE